jgi:hypothetical protein
MYQIEVIRCVKLFLKLKNESVTMNTISKPTSKKMHHLIGDAADFPEDLACIAFKQLLR